MAPSMKLTYFDLPGLGEPVRLALAQSGVEWEDNIINFDDWLALKPATPLGQLPVLEVDGVLIPQSLAQLRYVGKIGGLYPTDPIQAAFCDAAADACTDVFGPMRNSYEEKDEKKKASHCYLLSLSHALALWHLYRWLAKMEKVLESAGGMYFAGGKLSIGDIAVVARLNWIKTGTLEDIPPTIVDGSSLLSSLVERVMAEPKIAAYMKSRTKK
ncbi:unnamed protein product [Scytosiphon promiscuus]